MKPFLALLLCASIAANIFLFRGRSNHSATKPASAVAQEKKSAAPPALSAETWALVASGDPSSVEKLRALGLSESLITTLIRRLTDLRYRERENALLLAAASSVPYWSRKFDSARYGTYYSPERAELRRQKDAELKALLGPDYRKDDLIQDPRTAFLPPAKAEQLREIEEDYIAMQRSFAAYEGITLPEDREKRAFLEKQKRADLAELLTPQELADYDLRNSPTATSIRYELGSLDLTEDEFKTLYAIRKPYEERARPENGALPAIIGSGTVVIGGSVDAKQREALDAEIKAALGEERFAEYQRAKDFDYRTLNQLATRLELPREKATEAYTLKTALEKKLTEFKPQPGPNMRQQRADFLASLSREAETGFTQILGEKGYVTYKDHSQFFRRLQPPAPASTPAPR